MELRKLCIKDAKPMLEWMHDDSVVHYLETNFASKTLDDCKKFITDSLTDKKNLHLAIVDSHDNYMGTVSLKNIDKEEKWAEFAITVCKEAMGKGYSLYGMQEIIKIGFENLGLNKIYWYVSKDNERAVRFYEKNGFQKVVNLSEKIKEYNEEKKDFYFWFMIEK